MGYYSSNMSSRRNRSAVACQACRRRKVRCTVTVTGIPCINCSQDGMECTVAQRRGTYVYPYLNDMRQYSIQRTTLIHIDIRQAINPCARSARCLIRGPARSRTTGHPDWDPVRRSVAAPFRISPETCRSPDELFQSQLLRQERQRRIPSKAGSKTKSAVPQTLPRLRWRLVMPKQMICLYTQVCTMIECI
jgi:hypothetical protein